MQHEGVRRYKRDLRWPTGAVVTVVGIAIVLLARWARGDSWSEFVGIAVYSIGWALITFALIYVLSGVFESWKWGREDHDLVKKFEDGL
jgi:energy-converting hydrogenase Eha subunit G